ncbi:MAG: hypothetical protein AABZ31_08180 [Bdellovibrionota bacterium]
MLNSKIAAIGLLSFCIFQLGCSSAAKKSVDKIESLDVGAVQIKLVADTDFSEITRYVSKSVQKERLVGQKKPVRKTENVEFSVESKISRVDIENNRMFLNSKTIEKVGQADLHDFAMPEMGEEIVFELDQYARVYNAGAYPPSSIFFVPPISLPDEPVKKGETWSMHSEWVSLGNKAPFELEVTSTLKDIISCGDYRCADIEVSGNAKIIGADSRRLRFTSRVQGRYLFILEKGSVLWSLMRSSQQLSTARENIEISNCFLSRLEEPKKMKWAGVTSTTCDPTAEIPEDLLKVISL